VTINKRRTTVCMNLSKMEEAQAEQIGEDARIFMRIGKRFIINMQHVYTVDALFSVDFRLLSLYSFSF
jgi:DNA-binding LytR/AlgR family response regulator